MSKIFSTALFVSCAAAQLTTSAWMPGTGDSDISYEASVINVDNDRTTLSLSVNGLGEETDMIESMAQTVTLGGNTYYAFNGVVAEQGVTITVLGECSRQDTDEKSATCSISTKGFAEAMSSMCSEASVSEEMCASGAIDSNLSTTLPGGYFGMAQIVVTAGEDSLPSASAAATPSVGSASATASPSASPSPSASGASKSGKPTASDSESAANSGASKTSQPTAQSTNAAPLVTMAPALAGLGAAAAAFFL
jgi:hypothetical protein